jgi:hypothetical protein
MGDVQELGHDGGRGDLDEDDVVEADAVERVEQREATLDLVRFDHALEDILDRDALALARQVVRDGEDRPEIVGRVAPWEKKKGNDDVIRFIYIFSSAAREGGARYIQRRGSSRCSRASG